MDLLNILCRFTFECRLECDTKTPKIEWFKDFLPIQTPDLQATYHDGLCQLTIEETFSEDSAKYLCRATTDAGTAETTAFLKVKGKSLVTLLQLVMMIMMMTMMMGALTHKIHNTSQI